jgi:hypothetical protein
MRNKVLAVSTAVSHARLRAIRDLDRLNADG